jgi:hypothetical protein
MHRLGGFTRCRTLLGLIQPDHSLIKDDGIEAWLTKHFLFFSWFINRRVEFLRNLRLKNVIRLLLNRKLLYRRFAAFSLNLELESRLSKGIRNRRVHHAFLRLGQLAHQGRFQRIFHLVLNAF